MSRVPELTPELEAALRRLVAQPAIDRTVERPKKARRGVGGDIVIPLPPLMPAIAQGKIKSNGRLSVKLADENGDIIQVDDGEGGFTDIDAFDVWLFADRRTSIDVDDFIASDGEEVDNGVKVNLIRDRYGVYYLAMPTMLKTESVDIIVGGSYNSGESRLELTTKRYKIACVEDDDGDTINISLGTTLTVGTSLVQTTKPAEDPEDPDIPILRLNKQQAIVLGVGSTSVDDIELTVCPPEEEE